MLLNKDIYSNKASKRAIKSRLSISQKRLYLSENVAKVGEYIAIDNNGKIIKSDKSQGLCVNGQHFISLGKLSDNELKVLANKIKL